MTFGDAFDFSGTAAFSLEAWVKPSTVDATSRRVFSKEWSDSSGVQGYYLVSNSSRLQFARLRDGNYETLNGPALNVGTRYHLAVTYDGTTLCMYVNGANVATNLSPQGLLDSTAPFTIGAKASGYGNWSGTIDEPAVYSSALTAAQITDHYRVGSGT